LSPTDVGVLFGRREGQDSGADDVGLIIGVSVASVVAIVVVVVVVAGSAVGLAWRRHKRDQTSRAKQVNFDYEY
jgi:hypothetical protein